MLEEAITHSSFPGINENSIGIELVNKGHEFGYQNYTLKQVKSLILLCKDLNNGLNN